MKNTKMRKKMLLSSIAMLMVATVSLGSATYAWFTSNPKATAKGLSLKTTASAGLEIKTETDGTWSHEATLNKGGATFDLIPVSQEQNTGSGETLAGTANNLWNVAAEEATSYAAKSGATMTTATAGNQFYKEKVYFKLTDGADDDAANNQRVKLTGVAIVKNADATMEGAIKVAVADKNNVILGTYTLDTSAQNNHGVITGTAATAAEFNPALTEAKSTEAEALTQGLDVQCVSNAIKSQDTMNDYVTVYVYLDGQHKDCFSENVKTVNATEIISSISLNFELKDLPTGP